MPRLPDDKLKKELEKFYRRQRFFDHAKKVKEREKREEQWCRQLEHTRPVTPGLLKSCFTDLNLIRFVFDQTRIDSGKV